MGKQFSDVRGLWFEEFEIGLKVVSAGRTITETDVVTFAGLSGDYNQIHTDDEFTQSTNFGQRVAHGLLGLSVASGLVAQTGALEGTVIAFREISEWKFSNPIFFNDTIHVELTVKEKKHIPRLGGGNVKIMLNVINQRDEIVMKGFWTALILSKPGEE
ncbi:MAG: MaoC/PaaZ C-terminal domain-containing protein [Chloroflexota bacterium]